MQLSDVCDYIREVFPIYDTIIDDGFVVLIHYGRVVGKFQPDLFEDQPLDDMSRKMIKIMVEDALDIWEGE